jgi:hypothetical protein
MSLTVMIEGNERALISSVSCLELAGKRTYSESFAVANIAVFPPFQQ